MEIVIAGATGFIGADLCGALAREGHRLRALTRNPEKARQRLPAGVEPVAWDARDTAGGWTAAITGADAVVNLAGESIGEPRWSDEKKRRIRESRVRATRALVEAIRQAPDGQRPKVFVSVSAIGYYGDRGDEALTEASAPGDDFFAHVCQEWEAVAQGATSAGTRVVTTRLGIVLGPGKELHPLALVAGVLRGGRLIEEGGALQPLVTLHRLYAGGPLGSGRQWWSWVHREDVLGCIRFALEHDDLVGPMNVVAPGAVRMREFSHTLGRVLRRPSVLPAPAFALRLVLGEMADAMLLGSQHVFPAAAHRAGFRFQHPDLEPALRDILGT